MIERRYCLGRIVPLVTLDGVDPERIVVAPLADGQAALAIWSTRGTVVLVGGSDDLAPAVVAAHVAAEHRPILLDDSWTAAVCEVANCPQARAWLADEHRCKADAAGL